MKFLTQCGQSIFVMLLLCVGLHTVAAQSTYEVKSGETLDQVIRKTMGDSPLKMELLRQAFIDQNPQAFNKSSPRALMAGAILRLPNHDDLLRAYLPNGRAVAHSSGKSSAFKRGTIPFGSLTTTTMILTC